MWPSSTHIICRYPSVEWCKNVRNNIRLIFIALLLMWTVPLYTIKILGNEKATPDDLCDVSAGMPATKPQLIENCACVSVTLAILLKEQQNRRNATNRLMTLIKSSMTLELISTYTNSSDSEKNELTENDLENKTKYYNDTKQRNITFHLTVFNAMSSI